VQTEAGERADHGAVDADELQVATDREPSQRATWSRMSRVTSSP